jgi:hypothetical protein
MQRLLKRKSVAFAGPIVLAGCVTSAPPPPDNLSIDRHWSSSKFGFIYATYYYTEAQIDDPRWEKKRLESMETATVCETGKRVVRRDVRWFAPTPTSGRKCAAVVYTIQCEIPTLATNDTFDADRREQLEGELGKIGKGCGEKDFKKLHLADYNITNYQKYQSYLVDRNVCDFRSPSMDGNLQLKPATRVAVKVLIDRALAARFGSHALDDRFTSTVESALSQGLRRAKRLQSIFPAGGIQNDSSDNIRIELALGLNNEGRPYCVQLTARQGTRVWRRTIDRAGISDGRPMYLADDSKQGDQPSPSNDARALAEALRASLGLPDKTPADS